MGRGGWGPDERKRSRERGECVCVFAITNLGQMLESVFGILVRSTRWVRLMLTYNYIIM